MSKCEAHYLAACALNSDANKWAHEGYDRRAAELRRKAAEQLRMCKSRPPLMLAADNDLPYYDPLEITPSEWNPDPEAA